MKLEPQPITLGWPTSLRGMTPRSIRVWVGPPKGTGSFILTIGVIQQAPSRPAPPQGYGQGLLDQLDTEMLVQRPANVTGNCAAFFRRAAQPG